jgi:hypothetical protein
MKTIGRWTVQLDNIMIVHIIEGYWIDLERCRTSSQVLDWIMQVAKKSWADDETLASLVRALDYALRPQATLCCLGMERMLSLDELRQLLVTAETEANSED